MPYHGRKGHEIGMKGINRRSRHEKWFRVKLFSTIADKAMQSRTRYEGEQSATHNCLRMKQFLLKMASFSGIVHRP
jgi:hypothetical protein